MISSISHRPLPSVLTSKTQTTGHRAVVTTAKLEEDTKGKQSHILFSHLLSLSLAVTLNPPLPCLAIPSLNNSLPTTTTTPFSQSKNLLLGLESGKVRACPSVNPGCVSTNARSSSFAFPWRIPPDSTENAIQKLQEAILNTQKNATIQVVEDTSAGTGNHWGFARVLGQYLQAEVDGGFGRDVLEFLVKGDVVSYRCMATKVTYVYPFTTAFGDSKGQEERMKKIVDLLGWDAPSFDSMD